MRVLKTKDSARVDVTMKTVEFSECTRETRMMKMLVCLGNRQPCRLSFAEMCMHLTKIKHGFNAELE